MRVNLDGRGTMCSKIPVKTLMTPHPAFAWRNNSAPKERHHLTILLFTRRRFCDWQRIKLWTRRGVWKGVSTLTFPLLTGHHMSWFGGRLLLFVPHLKLQAIKSGQRPDPNTRAFRKDRRVSENHVPYDRAWDFVIRQHARANQSDFATFHSDTSKKRSAK